MVSKVKETKIEEFVSQYEDTKEIVKPIQDKELEVDDEPKKEERIPVHKQKQTETQKNEVNPIEEAARAQGWVPEEEWDGNPADWRPADVFLERGVYFKQMQELRKSNKKLNNQLNTLVGMQAKVREDERRRVLAELNTKKNQAIQDGDVETVVQVDKEIGTLTQSQNEESQALERIKRENESANQATIQNALIEFIADNPWYAKEPALRSEAETLSKTLIAGNSAITYEEMLSEISSTIKRNHPEKFKPETKQKEEEDYIPNPVGATTNTTQPTSKRGKHKFTEADLDDMHRQIGRRFVEQGAHKNIQEYVDELARIGVLQ